MAGSDPGNIRRQGRGKKLLAVWEWQTDKKRIEYCKRCRKDKELKEITPPCGDCGYSQGPELMDQNLDAMDLWLAANTQWRSGFSLIGLDYNVLFRLAEMMEIELSVCTFRKIQCLEQHVIDKQRKADAERDTQGRIQTQKGS